MLTLTVPTRPATVAWSSRLQLLLEPTGEGICGIDTDGRCAFINRAAAGMPGVAREGALGRNMHQLMHHSHADGRHYGEEDCPIFKAFREGKSFRVDSEVMWRAGGTCFAAEYSSYPIMDGGIVQGVVVAVVDISMVCRSALL
jgi:PAS domain S-box-containing protein